MAASISRRSDGFGVADGRPKLGAGVALAVLHFNVFSHELPFATRLDTARRLCAPLGLRELKAVALTLVAATSEIGTS